MTERTWLRTLGVVAATSTGTLALLLFGAVRSDQARAAGPGRALLGAAATGQEGGDPAETKPAPKPKAVVAPQPIEGGGMMPGMMSGPGGGMMMGGMAGGFLPGIDAQPEVQVVHVVRPPTAKAAAVWAALGKPLAMPFPNETPLEDVLKYLKQSTDAEPLKGGIPIYVDPAGLNEAEKTTTSPVQIDVEGIPLATTLRLVLRQLGLTYEVTDEGLLIISSEAGMAALDPTAATLKELRALRAEIAALRSEVTGGRSVPNTISTGLGGQGGQGGGWR